MLSRLIHRPIAVSMVCVAIAVLGVLALRYIPVSLMPDIAIPKITVQISADGMSAEEVEKTMVYPLRTQLAQVAGLKDIQTESRMDAGTMMLSFEPGADMDILFIEVNEKIDRAMNSMPRNMERPKVLKAGVMDIPAFFHRYKIEGSVVGHQAGAAGAIRPQHCCQTHRANPADGNGRHQRNGEDGNTVRARHDETAVYELDNQGHRKYHNGQQHYP